MTKILAIVLLLVLTFHPVCFAKDCPLSAAQNEAAETGSEEMDVEGMDALEE